MCMIMQYFNRSINVVCELFNACSVCHIKSNASVSDNRARKTVRYANKCSNKFKYVFRLSVFANKIRKGQINYDYNNLHNATTEYSFVRHFRVD